MKKTGKLFFTLLFVVFAMNFATAQNPTFTLTATNFEYTDSIGTGGFSDDAMTFDIMLLHTNSGVSGPFEFALGQYYFNVKALANSVNTDYTYYIVPGSSTFSNLSAIPRNPTFVMPDATSPSGASLRVNSNTVLGAGSGPIISTTFPGTRVAKFRFKKKAGSFDPVADLNFFQPGTGTYGSNTGSAWRLALANPFTKIFAYVGTTNTDISTQGTYVVDFNTALPVELASFTATTNRNAVSLNWSTATETNNAGFDVERKAATATEWTKVGNVAGNGTTSEVRNYTFTDRANTGTYNYRLKQLDVNGNFEYFNLSNEIEVGVPNSFDMSQNYPNPFNPSTKINYDLPVDGNVSIVLYDLTGRQVASIVNEVKTAGYYTVSFNASNLASGMYFYRISASNFVSTKKMVLVK
ncbi:MAG: T9SS type A sorting domain-containing protein [Ignavibacteria bacterium]|nr:T9SS type A sorting domain-containing protein [Ignavibacteria bacterium]